MAIGGLMDTNVPSQLDEDDLRAELEIEIPDSGADPMLLAIDCCMFICSLLPQLL